jgi:hypothetical protein
VEYASRSSGLPRVEASQDRVSQFTSKLLEARRRMVHVTPLRRSHEDQVEDGRVNTMSYVKPSYPCFVVFIVLGPRGVLVFCFGL